MIYKKSLIAIALLTFSGITYAQEATTSTIKLKIYTNKEDKIPEKKASFVWDNSVTATGGSNAAVVARVKEVLAISGIDCPPEWTDLGNNTVRCGNGKIVVMKGASTSFKEAMNAH